MLNATEITDAEFSALLTTHRAGWYPGWILRTSDGLSADQLRHMTSGEIAAYFGLGVADSNELPATAVTRRGLGGLRVRFFGWLAGVCVRLATPRRVSL